MLYILMRRLLYLMIRYLSLLGFWGLPVILFYFWVRHDGWSRKHSVLLNTILIALQKCFAWQLMFGFSFIWCRWQWNDTVWKWNWSHHFQSCHWSPNLMGTYWVLLQTDKLALPHWQSRPQTWGNPDKAINFTPRQADNLAPLETDIVWKILAQSRAGEHFWGRVPKLRVIFAEIISRVEYLSLLAPYVPLVQWRLSAPCQLAPGAAGFGCPPNPPTPQTGPAHWVYVLCTEPKICYRVLIRVLSAVMLPSNWLLAVFKCAIPGKSVGPYGCDVSE